MRPVAYPYPVLPASALPEPEWFVEEGDDLRRLSDGLRAWDAELPLALQTPLEGWPCFSELFESNGLAEALPHASLSLIAETGHSPITGHRFTVLHDSLENLDVEEGITVDLDSSRLVEKVTLHLLITVSACSVSGFQLREGSVLYRHAFSFPLEGSLATFPVRPVSFSEQRLGSALWLVDIGQITDLNQSLLGSILVYLNSDHKDVVDRLNSGEDRHFECLFQSDIVSTVLQVILVNEELEIDFGQTYADGSIGAAAAAWLATIREDSGTSLSIDMLREEMLHRPGVFRSRCQAFTLEEEEP